MHIYNKTYPIRNATISNKYSTCCIKFEILALQVFLACPKSEKYDKNQFKINS